MRFCEINLQSWHISQKIGWVPIVRAGSTHWVFLMAPWFFEWTQLDLRSIQWESYVNPVLCVFEKLSYKFIIFHKTLAEFLRFVLAVLIEFSFRHPGSLHEHSLPEGQSSEKVTWILSCAFFCEISLQSWHISQKIFWVPMVRAGSTHWVFLVTPWFFAWTQIDWRSIQWESYVNPVLCVFEKLAYKVGIFHKTLAEFLRFVLAVLIEFSLQLNGSWMNTVWLKVNPVRDLREFSPVRFCEIGLQIWQISKNHGWVPSFRGGSTHWVFLATPWFFAWT